MEKVIVRQISVGPLQVLTYLVACPRTKEAVIIDPAGDEERISDLAEREGVKVKYIMNTHGHADHVLANENLKNLFKAPTCMHEDDDRFFSREEIREAFDKEFGLSSPGPVDIILKHGQIVKVGDLDIEVIHTPGHTPGSVCF